MVESFNEKLARLEAIVQGHDKNVREAREDAEDHESRIDRIEQKLFDGMHTAFIQMAETMKDTLPVLREHQEKITDKFVEFEEQEATTHRKLNAWMIALWSLFAIETVAVISLAFIVL